MLSKHDSLFNGHFTHPLHLPLQNPSLLLADGPSTGLILSPGALEVTSSNRFFRYSSVGYTVTPKGYDAWSIANYWSWNSTKYLSPVWDQGACGERHAGLILMSMVSCEIFMMGSDARRSSDWFFRQLHALERYQAPQSRVGPKDMRLEHCAFQQGM